MIDQHDMLNMNGEKMEDTENEKWPARASLPKTALAGLYFIDRQIASGKYQNTTYLAEA